MSLGSSCEFCNLQVILRVFFFFFYIMGTAFALMDVGYKCHGLKNPYCCDMDLLDMHVPCVGCTQFFKYLYQSKILSNGVSSLIRERIH